MGLDLPMRPSRCGGSLGNCLLINIMRIIFIIINWISFIIVLCLFVEIIIFEGKLKKNDVKNRRKVKKKCYNY